MGQTGRTEGDLIFFHNLIQDDAEGIGRFKDPQPEPGSDISPASDEMSTSTESDSLASLFSPRSRSNSVTRAGHGSMEAKHDMICSV